MSVVFLSPLLISELIQQTGEFPTVFKHFQNLENLNSNILKEKLHKSCLARLE